MRYHEREITGRGGDDARTTEIEELEKSGGERQGREKAHAPLSKESK